VRTASTILLVEDESAVRYFGATVLERLGHTVLQAADGEQALVLAGQHSGPIHLLFTDIMMPGLSGRDLARQFSAMHTESKVLLTSGYAEGLAAGDSLEQGINFLAKPFSAEQLSRIVDRLLAE
jgi:two-component system cell cycle sensor histidine kinase/response regulator CckA